MQRGADQYELQWKSIAIKTRHTTLLQHTVLYSPNVFGYLAFSYTLKLFASQHQSTGAEKCNAIILERNNVLKSQ